jgi:hypothetical protein
LRLWLSTACGAVAAILILEIILRFFVTSWHTQEGRVRTIRQYTEGVATSTFEADGFGTYGHRRTGNPVLPGAPTVLLIGDSHVVQEAVPDRDTLGAVIERLSRAGSTPVNVRQYGWYNTAAPTYIATAGDLLKTNQPKAVVALMNGTDFGGEPLIDGWYWRMKIRPDLSIDLIDVRAPEPTGALAKLKSSVGRSSLLLSIWRRSVLLFAKDGQVRAATGGDIRLAGRPLIARASVRGLKAAYGSLLVIVYTPFSGQSAPESYEAELLDACAAEHVNCISTRSDMAADAQSNRRILRGFHNTAPGVDHLNQAGLQVVGAAIWRGIAHLLR